MVDAGVEANARLTAATGALLFVLLAAEGITVVAIRPLLSEHIFIGLVLVPPALLKMGSTFYRFARYYTGDPRYRLAGPPEPALRLLGPVVVVSTVILLGSGIELWLFGSRFGIAWAALHKLSFVIWFLATTVHVIGHIERTPRLLWQDLAGRDRIKGRVTRGSLVGASLLLGVILAVATLSIGSPLLPDAG